MTSKVAYLAAAAIALALPASAFAQNNSPRVPGTEPALPSIQAPSMNDRVAPGGLQRKSFESADLKGKDVYDPAGKKVGEIDEVVPTQGQPREAIVAVGGILGIGAKKGFDSGKRYRARRRRSSGRRDDGKSDREIA